MVNNIKLIHGRGLHNYLVSKAYKIFNDKGYKVSIEKKIKNTLLRPDLTAKNKDEIVFIEILVRPNLDLVLEKVGKYKSECSRFVIVYPEGFIPKFPIEDYAEIIKIPLPDNQKADRNKASLYDVTTNELMILKYHFKLTSIDQTVNKLFEFLPKDAKLTLTKFRNSCKKQNEN